MSQLINIPSEIVFEHFSFEEIILAGTNKVLMNAISTKYATYHSTFAPDIVNIPNNFIGNNVLGCNKYITHQRIKNIMQKNNIPIPADGVNVIPILNSILLDTIRTNIKSDCEFLVSIGVIIIEISDNLFRNQLLQNVYIPSSVTRIGDGAFADNYLTTITIPRSVTIIEDNAFNNNILRIVNLPDTLITIGRCAFLNNQIENITIPQNVTQIDDGAFTYNYLKTITIPPSVRIIGNIAFRHNRLTTVNINSNVGTTFGYGIFKNNPVTNVAITNHFNQRSEEFFDNVPTIIFNLL